MGRQRKTSDTLKNGKDGIEFKEENTIELYLWY